MNDAIVWVEPERAAFAGRVAAAAGLAVVGAGGPGRAGASSAQRLEAEPVPDLRSALSDSSAGVVLVFDAGDFGTAESAGDAEAVLAAASRGAHVIAMDPVPASVFELSSGGWLKTRHGRRAIDAVRFGPGAGDHRVLASLGEVLSSFGEVRVASARALGQREHAGLGSAVVSGLSLLRRVLGPVEKIDAAVIGRNAGERSGAVDDRLRSLHGHATAMARAEHGAVGRLFASDAADRWERALELIGPNGRLVVSEGGFEWTDPSGAVVDSGTVPAGGEPAEAALSGAIRGHVDQPEPRGEEFVDALLLAQAALLSARTREPESPAAMARATVL